MNATNINKTFLIILLGILAALGPFSIDMYLPAFQRIGQYFNTDSKQVAFTLTSYFAGISFGQLIYGPIVDKYGRKKPLIIGLSIYIIASLGCAFSINIDMMIGMRLLQALGACVGMVASNAIINDVYEKDKMAKAFSSLILVMGVAPLIAPSLGSLFLEKLDWYYIFIFLAVFAGLIVAMIYFFLPETSKYMHNKKLKVKTISVDYWSILKNKTFIIYTLIGSISMAVLFAYIASASPVFQRFYKLDNASFSIIFAINATGLIIGSSLNGWLTKKIHFLRIAKIAIGLLFIWTLIVMMTFIFLPHLPFPYLVIGLFFTLFIVGFINPNATAASLFPFHSNVGAASALSGAVRMGIGALIAATMGILDVSHPRNMFITIFSLATLCALLFLLAPNVPKRIKKD
ncbi:MAG TPA: multidrug effflux MFS transporter [Edaphocola sp.]|nr:multidrug effflux MFS transporter [Edaphocola sp.]